MKLKTCSILILIIILCFSLFNIAALANPVSEVDRQTARVDLKNSLENTYGNSYSTIEMLLNAGMKAYKDEIEK